MRDFSDPSLIPTDVESRSISFENPTGGRGSGGTAHGGRKGSPSRRLKPGERVVLADIEGPGVVRHMWMTFPPSPPEHMRALLLEVFYDGADRPSISVPCLDFFGLSHGRPAVIESALVTAQEGRGFNSYIPMPFDRSVRIEIENGGERSMTLYHQVDYTLEPDPTAGRGYLHATFRRENPTTLGQDFVIASGLRGPGRFLGCNIGVRIIDDCAWWGEGEVKVYLDGDTDHPTICGTGLEDYVGSAWGLGEHTCTYGGAPLVIGEPSATLPDFISFYRWHVLDPILYREDLTVTIQQIGAMSFPAGADEALAAYERTNPVAGAGWNYDVAEHLLAWGLAERVDDYCATAYVYCTTPQPVPRCDIAAAVVDIARRDYEVPSSSEALLAVFAPPRESPAAPPRA